MKWYSNQKITNKLIIGFLVLSLIAAIVGGFGILTIARIKESGEKMNRENVRALQFAAMANIKTQAIISSAQSLTRMDAALEAGSIMSGCQKLTQSLPELEESITKLRGVLTGEGNRVTVEDLARNWDNLKTYIKAYADDMQKPNGAKAAAKTLQTADTAASILMNDFTKVIEQSSNESSAKAEDNSKQANIAMLAMGSMLAVAIVLSVVLGRAISNSIGNPLKVIAAVCKRIAEGDVNVDDIMTEKEKKLTNRKDEIGTLASMFSSLVTGATEQAQETRLVANGDLTVEINLKSDRDLLGLSLRELVSNFHNMVMNIADAAAQLASNSDAVSNSSMVLSQGATEQASAIEELNVTLEGISSQTNLNAKNAEEANALSRQAKENAENGNKQMQEMLTAMGEINESSRNINKVIKVIDDIAFQTNILALNAAVEAARAGQAGRGFAVVAEEVRALAGRSANAVKDTTDMIEGSIRKVAIGTKIANDTATALNEILLQIDKVAVLVNAIDAASKEQALGIKQINQGITQVSQVVQTNAATAQESAAASEELLSQATQLREQVGVFKLHTKESMPDELHYEMMDEAAPVFDDLTEDGDEENDLPPGPHAADGEISFISAGTGKY